MSTQSTSSAVRDGAAATAEQPAAEPRYFRDGLTGEIYTETCDEIVEYFPSPSCDGHGAKVIRVDGRPVRAELCGRCGGEGELGATLDQFEAASQIGSNNPFCPHDWSSGYDDSDHEVPIRCSLCGANGDA